MKSADPFDIEQIATVQKAANYILTHSKKDYIYLRGRASRHMFYFILKSMLFIFIPYYTICLIWYLNGNYINELNLLSFEFLEQSPVQIISYKSHQDAWSFPHLLSLICQPIILISFISHKNTKILIKNRIIISYPWYMIIYLFIMRSALLFIGYLFIVFSSIMFQSKTKGAFSPCSADSSFCFLQSADMFHYASIYGYIIACLPLLLFLPSLISIDLRSQRYANHDIIDWEIVRKYRRFPLTKN